MSQIDDSDAVNATVYSDNGNYDDSSQGNGDLVVAPAPTGSEHSDEFVQ